MKPPIRLRLGDLNYVAIAQAPLTFALKTWMEKPENAALVPAVPDWLLPFSVGVSIATLCFDILYRDHSRLRELWGLLTRKYQVEKVSVGQFGEWCGQQMPDTDVGVRLTIRFKRSGKFRLFLRVFSCTGRGKRPFEHLISLGDVDAVTGQPMNIPIVDMALSEPGWDHTRKRGWGPKKEQNLVGGSHNVAVFECRGRFFTQKHRVYIAMVNHDTGQQKFKPCLYVQEEADEIWDVSEGARIREWRDG